MSTPASIPHTPHRVVIPFYGYAAVSLLIATGLLFTGAGAFTGHYFHPHILAITHLMALGWGTMVILGSAYQLLPVLTGSPLYSVRMAIVSFWLAAMGIPLLVYAFHVFDMGWPALVGAALVIAAVCCLVVNIAVTVSRAPEKKGAVHAWFIFAAALWLLITAFLGLLLLIQFTRPFLPHDALYYLPLHAHTGIVGWFLLLIIGVGSRLIPMFLVSGYSRPRLLWLIFGLLNGALLLAWAAFLYWFNRLLLGLAAASALAAVLGFVYYCRGALRQRLRKKVDGQLRVSLLSVLLMLLALILTVLLTVWMNFPVRLILIYGFLIFFGVLTALIFGMTFKTLPFIVWNRRYQQLAGMAAVPQPGDLFSRRLFTVMMLAYGAGLLMFITAASLGDILLLRIASLLLMTSACCYNLNVVKILFHQPVSDGPA